MQIRNLSKELQVKATEELNENTERIKDDVKYIKKWLSQQSYINARTDDQFILSFLRGCKFSLERTKEKIETFYTMKSIVPEFFDNRDPLLPELQEALSIGVCLPLPKLASPTAPRVILIRTGGMDPGKMDQSIFFKVITMIQTILLLEDDNFTVSGTIVLQDMKGVGVSHALHTSPSVVKKAMCCFQQAYPNRIKGIYFINISSVFETLHKLFRPFMTAKMQSRMKVYTESEMDSLYDFIPKETLPKEYGGESGTVEELSNHWKNKVESYRKWFLEDAKYKTDENKRPGKPKTSESVFGLGVEGSFRRLAVD